MGAGVLGTVVAWLAFGLSLVVAINQFGAARPYVQVRRFPLSGSKDTFIVDVVNSSNVNIHLFGVRTFSKNRLVSSSDGTPYVDDAFPEGTVNLIVPPGTAAELTAVVT